MIYPTRRAILSAAAVAPVALLIGVAVPAYWPAGLALLAFLLALMGIDALVGPRTLAPSLSWHAPAAVGVGERFEVLVGIGFPAAAPPFVEVALGRHSLLSPFEGLQRRIEVDDLEGDVAVGFAAVRRGAARFEALWIRWPGMFGLVWKQRRLAIDETVLVTPDIRPVREKSAQMLHRDFVHGLVAQLQVGEGAEFEALADYRAGMDRRSIDWKQSARHNALIAKEYRTERNNHIVLAIDSGRMMCEPIEGVPRLDRAVSAALLTAFVALKEGDRVGLFGFDSRPRLASKTVSGQRAFALLQRLAADLDYSPLETNYTFALATLAAGLTRRSLIIVFTDFADTTSAELMLAAVGTLLRRHLVLFVVMRDEELEGFAEAEPATADDVTRAVTAAALLRERRLVNTRLRHLGVQVLEAAHDEVGPALLNAYLDIKRRGAL